MAVSRSEAENNVLNNKDVDEVLIERDGKFELVSAADMSATATSVAEDTLSYPEDSTALGQNGADETTAGSNQQSYNPAEEYELEGFEQASPSVSAEDVSQRRISATKEDDYQNSTEEAEPAVTSFKMEASSSEDEIVNNDSSGSRKSSRKGNRSDVLNRVLLTVLQLSSLFSFTQGSIFESL